MQDCDFYVLEVRYVDGFVVGCDGDQIWMLYCFGMMVMVWDNEVDSVDVEFFIVIGYVLCYFDCNMMVFGWVLEGMEYIQVVC